ncbi:Early light-induced protein 1 [Ranunculus cassubicifolius]
MASSSLSVQSFQATPTSRFGRKNTTNVALPSLHFPRQQRNSSMQVRCMTEVSRKLSDVMAFSGPAPERINGRLAMIGFVSAIAAELALGDDVAVQVANGGLNWFVGSVVVLSLASLAPLIKGVSVESKSKGFMTSDAEMWNGRFAMLGLVALVFTEFVKGGALV